MKNLGRVISDGKTKSVYEEEPTVIIKSKDDITAGDGARRDQFAGKAALATQTTVNCFELLEREGVPTHYVGRIAGSGVLFRALRMDMIPVELVTRRLAYGSYLKRNPETKQGTRFETPVFEMFAKDDKNHDPLLEFDDGDLVTRYDPTKPVGESSVIDRLPLGQSPFTLREPDLSRLRELAVATFEIIEAAWADQDVTLVDMKIECGRSTRGELVVADVIDNDSWRIWPGGDPENMADKQLYRDGKSLDFVADRYAWVAEATNAFGQ
jgi:phosphoribosylaminoimidazole-succinocarboxamide synthase